MLPDIHRATQKFYIFLIVYLTGCTPKITYICDFSRCGLNTRLYTLVSKLCSKATNIGYFIYCELSLAAYANSEFILRKI